jgi:hypothetical protein
MSAPTIQARGSFSKSGGALEIGFKARFIRWINSRDGWYPEVIHGVYCGQEDNSWVISIDGNKQSLPNHTWAIYRP